MLSKSFLLLVLMFFLASCVNYQPALEPKQLETIDTLKVISVVPHADVGVQSKKSRLFYTNLLTMPAIILPALGTVDAAVNSRRKKVAMSLAQRLNNVTEALNVTQSFHDLHRQAVDDISWAHI